MPLPEGMSELSFVVLAKRRFRYAKNDGYTISADADFVICGEIHPNDLKPEGPFGDHLGYYSLVHDFPVLKSTQGLHKREWYLAFYSCWSSSTRGFSIWCINS